MEFNKLKTGTRIQYQPSYKGVEIMKILLIYINDTVNLTYNNVILNKTSNGIDVLSNGYVITSFEELKLELICSKYSDKKAYKIISCK